LITRKDEYVYIVVFSRIQVGQGFLNCYDFRLENSTVVW